jgi:hypothetical protein
MLYAVSIMALGYTRINGVVAYNNETREFLELTPAYARKLIDSNLLIGLKWKNSDRGTEFICDLEGWNQQDIPVRTACGKFRPYINDVPGVEVRSMYTLVRVLDTDYRGRLYEVVSNKACRVKLNEQAIKELNTMTNIAGLRISETGNIEFLEGVEYVDRRATAKCTVDNIDIDSFGKDTALSESVPEPEPVPINPDENKEPAGDIVAIPIDHEETALDTFEHMSDSDDKNLEDEAKLTIDDIFDNVEINKKDVSVNKKKKK